MVAQQRRINDLGCNPVWVGEKEIPGVGGKAGVTVIMTDFPVSSG